MENIQEPVSTLFASMSSGILSLLGQGTTSSGMTISSPKYSLLIQKGCDAITPNMLLVTGILIFPSGWDKKWKGIAFLIGAALLLLFFLHKFGCTLKFPAKGSPVLEQAWTIIIFQ